MTPHHDPLIQSLGDDFYDPVEPAAFPKTIVRRRLDRWADRIGLGGFSNEAWIDRFARFEPFDGNLPQPLALRYHGHQFRVYNPDIGDGRGFLYAQLRDPTDGRLLDFGTKGSGQTPYCRQGDGRLTLKGGVREILASEMLEALGVYTSKTYSLIETGESLWRGDEPSPTRSAVLVRLSHGHIRHGAFQRLAYFNEPHNISRLVDYCVAAFFPALTDTSGEERVARFFDAIVMGAAELAASYLAAGFVHGVLNTDNQNVTGESFDYGPWRFLPTLDYDFTAAYFDHGGLYAYGRQPEAVFWSLNQLAGSLSIICAKNVLEGGLERFPERFRAALARRAMERLGLYPKGLEADAETAKLWFEFLTESQAPFEQAQFDHWAYPLDSRRAAESPEATFYQGPRYDAFRDRLADYAPVRSNALSHPYFARPRPETILIDEVESIWARIAENDDWTLLESKLKGMSEARDAYALDPDRGRARSVDEA